MTFLLEKLDGSRLSHLFLILIHIISIVLVAVWVYFGMNFFSRGGVLANSLPYQMYYVYIAPPIFLSLTGLVAVQKLCHEIDEFIHYQSLNHNK